MKTELVLKPLDDILARYGATLCKMGDGNAHKAMARALNYEGAKTYTLVKRTLRKQTSIPTAEITKSTKFLRARTAPGSGLEIRILGKGRELSLKRFGPRQFGGGVKATIWGKRQFYRGAFMGARPGLMTVKLHGHVFARMGKERLPIHKLFGPSVPKEMVKDQTAAGFYSSLPRIIDRVGKEIAAVMRGY